MMQKNFRCGSKSKTVHVSGRQSISTSVLTIGQRSLSDKNHPMRFVLVRFMLKKNGNIYKKDEAITRMTTVKVAQLTLIRPNIMYPTPTVRYQPILISFICRANLYHRVGGLAYATFSPFYLVNMSLRVMLHRTMDGVPHIYPETKLCVICI